MNGLSFFAILGSTAMFRKGRAQGLSMGFAPLNPS
jgi:hypothetical protein